MHLHLPHGPRAAALLGVAVWLAGLTAVILVRDRQKQKKAATYVLGAYLALSAVALVVAGVAYARRYKAGLAAAPLTAVAAPDDLAPKAAPKAPDFGDLDDTSLDFQ
jgi:hypothetical protein